MTSKKVILALDTSSDRITISISKGDHVILDESHIAENNHAKKVLQTIDQALKKSETKLEDIDAFATTIGPGSFTGLRTSMGTMKGFCFSMQKPLIGIPPPLCVGISGQRIQKCYAGH